MRKRINQPPVTDLLTTKIHTMTPETSLNDVIQLLVKCNETEIPVQMCDGANQKLLGSITDRDCLEYLSNEAFYHSPNITAKSVIKPLPKGVSPETDIFTAASILISYNSRYLPVVEGKNLLGVVSRRDVLKGLHAYRDQMTDEQTKRKSPLDLNEIANHRFIVSAT